MSVLDNPVWWALAGSQRHLGSVSDRVARFDPEVSPFAAAVDAPTDDDWAELAGMAGPGGQLALIEQGEGAITPGHGWTAVWEASGVQMVWDRADVEIGARPLRTVESPTPTPSHPIALGQDDAGDMLDLVAVARPGPFLARTVEFGGYLGVRDAGRLIAMAGERLRPPGFTEISAVATDPGHRRRGLGERLVRAVGAAIVERGDIPFLHAASTNVTAIRLYESMGFVVRRPVAFVVLRAPGGDGGPVG